MTAGPAALLAEARRPPAAVHLTPAQIVDLVAIRTSWNADRIARGLQRLALEDVLGRVLHVTAGLVGGPQ